MEKYPPGLPRECEIPLLKRNKTKQNFVSHLVHSSLKSKEILDIKEICPIKYN